MAETDSTILEMGGVHKSFGTSAALKNVQFELKACEIHGLLGGNGAGKTTLMNILYGLYRMDSGKVVLHGRQVEILSPRHAIQHGIGMVHQHFLQIQNFTVIQNIVLGSDVKNKLTMNLEAEEKKLRELCERFGLDIDLNAVVEDLPMGTRQKVEILKALYRGVEILILDEPTTNLTPQEVDDLFASLRVMVTAGMSIVFITHKLREVLSVCDRISVLRNGENVLTLKRSEATEEAFVRGMVGDEMKIEDSLMFADADTVQTGREVGDRCMLEMERVNLTSSDNLPVLKNITLEIQEKEILGIAGVAGNGQRELAEVIFGVQPVTSGTIRLHGQEINGKATQELLAAGIAYIPEDRMHDGFLPKGNLAQNLILGYHNEDPYSSKGFMNWNKIFSMSWDLIRKYNIKTSGPTEAGGNLSGGNIQRVLIARAFSRPSKLLIMHNPTRGLDIPSMDFVYNRLLERKQQGTATILLSENLDELLLLCDRIAVVYRGEIVGVLERSKFEKYEIGRMMSGVRTND